ncbi:MAG: transporter substrate-binding domain-containing protein [Oscillospiraceae bacterium]|nr:transporter substrate-binding domain-containing protein [Oscillospiraceae bacterium]
MTYLKKLPILLLTGLFLLSGAGCSKQEEEEIPPEDLPITSIQDLNGKRIGTQLATTGSICAKDIENVSLQTFIKGRDAISALKQQKLDAVIIDSEPAKVFVSENKGLKILAEPFMQEEYSIAYHKDNTDLGAKINDALETLQENGTLEEIKTHWIGDEADQVSYQPDASKSHTNGKIIMATNAEFPPYESKDGEKIVGIDVDMMLAVCDELGMELEIKNMQFDSIIPSIKSGKADVGVAGISITPEREEEVAFTQSYATSNQVVIILE